MVTACYSTILDHPVETVWPLIRDFNNYPAYIDGVVESVIEDDKRGDEIGAIRRFLYRDNWIRQRLVGHSDGQRSLTYAGMEPFAFPDGLTADKPAPVDYQGTLRLHRVVEGGRTFIEWSVTVEAGPEHVDLWQGLLLSLISDWTASLGRALVRRTSAEIPISSPPWSSAPDRSVPSRRPAPDRA